VADPGRARTFVVRAVHAHHWKTSLPVLVRARPDLLGVLAGEVMALAERQRETTVS